MKGFIFELETSCFSRKYYFIESNYKRKSKKVATQFLEYFAKKLEGTFIPLNVWNNTHNKIYNNMYKATVIDRAKSVKAYDIYVKHSGYSVPEDVVIIIK